jgi:hypothetical protein
VPELLAMTPDQARALMTENVLLREELEAIEAFARSGWNDGTYTYCLVCDAQLCLVPGKLKGQRAATFDEITHDPECPVPSVTATLRATAGTSRTAPQEDERGRG